MCIRLSLGRRDSDGSGGLLRRGSHTTPVTAIREGILDNDAIGALGLQAAVQCQPL